MSMKLFASIILIFLCSPKGDHIVAALSVCTFICASVHPSTSCWGHNYETTRCINKKLCR